MNLVTNGLKFAGTFIIRVNPNQWERSLTRAANPDHLEGYSYKKTGLFESPHDFLVIRNETIEKDKRVLDWLQDNDLRYWSHYTPAMTSDKQAAAMVKVFA